MTLRNAVFVCFSVGLLLLVVAVAVVLPGFAERVGTRTLGQTTVLQTNALAEDIARLLEADWSDLQFLVSRAPEVGTDRLGDYLDGIVSDGERVAWAGFASLDGTVQVASNGLIEGQDVTARPWFSGGLRGGFAGDVHEAVLLQALLGQGEAAEPLRFIDLAAPVLGQAGDTDGVIGLHINSTWLERYLSEAATNRGMEFYVVSASGVVAASSTRPPREPLALEPFRLAAAGRVGLVQAEFPDSGEQVCAVNPQILRGDLPSFGWRLVGCADYAVAAVERNEILRLFIALGLAGAAFFAISSFVFVRVFLAPVTRLVDSADRISRGEDAYPQPSRTTREAGVLAAALARLQAR